MYRLQGDPIVPALLYCKVAAGFNGGAFLQTPIAEDDTLKGTMTHIVVDTPLQTSIPGVSQSGLQMYGHSISQFHPSDDAPGKYFITGNFGEESKEWTAIFPFVTGFPVPYFFQTNVGTLVEYYRRQFSLNNDTPVLLLNLTPDGVVINIVHETELTVDTNANQYRQNGTGVVGTKITDLVRLPFGGGQLTDGKQRITGLYPLKYRSTQAGSSGQSSLRGVEVGYPPSWSSTGADATLETSLMQGSVDFRGAGRGLYCGTSTNRYNMPTLVPGSGTDLSTILIREGVSLGDGVEAPRPVAYVPEDPMFAQTNQIHQTRDIGGPIAYVFYGTLMRPRADAHKNQAVLQISGGPTGGIDAGTKWEDGDGTYSPEDLHGTAIDAFWPVGRPLFRSGE